MVRGLTLIGVAILNDKRRRRRRSKMLCVVAKQVDVRNGNAMT